MNENIAQGSESTDPRENTARAWEIFVNPKEFVKGRRKQLISRGVQQYETDTGVDEMGLLEDVAEYIAEALDQPDQDEVIQNYTQTDPGQLCLLSALSAVLFKRQPQLENDPRRTKAHRLVRRHTSRMVFAAAHSDPYASTIRISIGEAVYRRRQEDDRGPPPGRTVEGVVEPFDQTQKLYYQIPLVHANRRCEARDSNGEMQALIDGKYVLVPVDDVEDKYKEQFVKKGGLAKAHENRINGEMSDHALDDYTNRLTGLQRRISDLIESNNDRHLFEKRSRPPKLEVMVKAVRSAPNDEIKLGEPLTAGEVVAAVAEYGKKTTVAWEENVVSEIDDRNAVSNLLTMYDNDSDISGVSFVGEKDGDPAYKLEYAKGGSKLINVETIEDVLELPCMANLHDKLLEQKGVRWELYTFVRYLLEIDEGEIDKAAIKEWFKQYPWHRKEVTDYQVDYESRQTIGDDRPLPVGCNNDNRHWSEHCIGKEHCDYSLYRSIQLSDDVYERLDDFD